MKIQPFLYLTGWASALIAYPIAERMEKRDVRPKWDELKRHYALPFAERRKRNALKLAQEVAFAGSAVPYYRDLFQTLNFEPAKLLKDIKYLDDLPYLTKDIIREQKDRMLSKPLHHVRHHLCKTGGSTGLSCHIYYDQPAADYAAAVMLFARDAVGKKKHKAELHFASRFPDVFPLRARIREHMKCFAMNRSNIFFDRLDDAGLQEIWNILRSRRPFMAHAHPSTIYALACYIERTKGKAKAFDIFESSGELLEPHMRTKITDVLCCDVIDRYGLAEFGVIAYQMNAQDLCLTMLDSEGWMELAAAENPQQEQKEIVFTGFRNRLMPLIRYRTGDMAAMEATDNGIYLTNMLGRIHDLIPMGGTQYPTHYVQDVLDRVGGIQEFQIDLRNTPPKLLIVPEAGADTSVIQTKLKGWWKDDVQVVFGGHNDIVRVGQRDKFRHIVPAGTP